MNPGKGNGLLLLAETNQSLPLEQESSFQTVGHYSMWGRDAVEFGRSPTVPTIHVLLSASHCRKS